MDNVNTALNTHLCSGDSQELAKPLKVSELVLQLKNEVEQRHRFVRVVGEVSSFKQWRSGHCYFDIKDEQALLPAVIFRPHFQRVPFAVADGMLVMFSGRVSIYQANCRLQMIVEEMEPLGQGALALAFEQLKERLKGEGLFDATHKKSIKPFNETIGIVTSSHGAVLRDMVRILKARMPQVTILFSPVRVQGAGAAAEIANAIHLLDQMECCDLLIVGRGGGSLEDLWPFNEEVVARAIFNANTPIISAVGHETDFTISDFVADVRAATPTHAASLAVPEVSELLRELCQLRDRFKLKHEANLRSAMIFLAEKKRKLKDPRVLLFRHWQRMDETNKRMSEVINAVLREANNQCTTLKKRLVHFAPIRQLRVKKDMLNAQKHALVRLSPKFAIEKAKNETHNKSRLLNDYVATRLKRARNDFSQQVMKLDALSPLKVLSRGYGLVQSETEQVLSRVAHVMIGQTITVRMEDGSIKACVTQKEQV